MYSPHSRIPPVLRQNRNKTEVVADGKLFLKAWSIELLQRSQKTWYEKGCMAQKFSTWLCLPAWWIYVLLVTASQHWYLLSLNRKLERLVCLEFLPNPIGWQFAAISTERKRFFPRPKNDGAACIGETRRTSGCDNGNIPLGMENGWIQDSFVTALHSGLCL